MLTDAAVEVAIWVPRDRAGTFEPVIVAKRPRCMTDVVVTAISLNAMGLTTGEISAHVAEDYGGEHLQGHGQPDYRHGRREDAGMASRPLQGVNAAIFIDAICVGDSVGQVRLVA